MACRQGPASGAARSSANARRSIVLARDVAAGQMLQEADLTYKRPGTGVSPQLDGILTTATGTQAYATSPLVTIRTGLSQLEAAGLVPSAIILAAADWLAIELALLTTDGFMLGNGTSGAPLDSVRRTLWGTPVVVSIAHVAGTALILSEESVGLVTDGNIDFMWGRIADDFAKNQVRARAEIRAGVEIFRPSGIINCDLIA